MAVNVLERRELYVDVTVKEGVLEEIFLYQVDFLKDKSFRNREYLFHREEKIEEKQEETPEESLGEEDVVDITELFKEQWEQLLDVDVPVEVFATDVKAVLDELFLGLVKKYPELTLHSSKSTKKELMHDFISMGRVTSMSMFDELQYLSAAIRRRLKEKYHERVDEVKQERNEHIFMRQMAAGSPYELELFVTDGDYHIRKNILLPKSSNEESLTLKLAETLAQYPEADLVVDKISIGLYQLLNNMTSFMTRMPVPAVFSLESMFYAAGKELPSKELVENYVQYIRNLEDLRFGRFVSNEVHSVHTFYLPVRISGEKDWKKQFVNNTIWKAEEEDAYCIQAEGELKGKYIIKAGKEQFVLKLKSVSLKKYLRQYAVLRIEVENHCYPGEMDKERINFLASYLFSAEDAQGPDCIELKIKAAGQAYSLSTVRIDGNEEQMWLNGLLMLGRKKKKDKKHNLVMTSVSEKMYCVEICENEKEDEIIRKAILRGGILKEIERKLAVYAAPVKKSPIGKLSGKQKKQIRGLFGKYRYLVVSFGAEYKDGRTADRQLWALVETRIDMNEVAAHLKEKFDLFFA